MLGRYPIRRSTGTAGALGAAGAPGIAGALGTAGTLGVLLGLPASIRHSDLLR